MMEWVRVHEVEALEEDEVQVWRLSAMQGAEVMEACRARLSAEESKRVGRTRAGFARDEFVVGRALLRALVGRAVGCAAEAVEFRVGKHGKPWVDGVEFNVSHSRGMVLIALCRGTEVGVDVEGIHDGIEALEIAEASFAGEEIARIRAAEGVARVREFYSIWTRKEAVTKAHGDGLTMGLGGFSVADEARMVRVMVECGAGEEWYAVEALPMGEGFAAALALKGEARMVRCAELTPVGVAGRNALIANEGCCDGRRRRVAERGCAFRNGGLAEKSSAVGESGDGIVTRRLRPHVTYRPDHATQVGCALERVNRSLVVTRDGFLL